MTKKRRQHTAQFKFRVALEAAGEAKTISEIASDYKVHPTMVRNWKKQLLSEGSEVFQHGAKRKAPEQGVNEAELYEQIGRLKMELEWVKKKAEQFGGG
jgi:transposase-like protein